MNFNFPRGDDQVIELEFKEDGVPINITNWKVYFTLKKNKSDSDNDAVIKKDVTVHTEPLNGKTQILLTNTETDSLNGIYYYDIQYKDDSSNIKTVLWGMINFFEDITRRKA